MKMMSESYTEQGAGTTEAIKRHVQDAFRFRHACKEFDAARTIAADDWTYILEAGRLSPSSFGWEPWQFVVLQDRSIRERLLPVTWGARRTLPTASHFLLLLTRRSEALQPDSPHIRHMARDIQQLPDEVISGKGGMYASFLTADWNLAESDRLVFEWASRQTYIALGNMMTAAALIGIDSCPIEGFVLEPAETVLREAGILEDGLGLSCMAAFGYRANEPRPKTRRPLDEVVKWV